MGRDGQKVYELEELEKADWQTTGIEYDEYT